MTWVPALVLLLLPVVACAETRINDPDAHQNRPIAVVQYHWRTRPDGSLDRYLEGRKKSAWTPGRPSPRSGPFDTSRHRLRSTHASARKPSRVSS